MTTTPAAVGPKTNTLSIVTLIAGILGFNIIAVILGHISLGQIKRTGEGGRVLAIIGLILGYIGLITLIIVIIVSVVAAANGAITVTTN
jgi:hypothetical protein